MIAVSDLLKHYPDSSSPIIDQLSLNVIAGQSVSIQGASGCGKSTLLALLAGVEQSSGGTIVIAGHALERLSQEAADSFRMHHLGVIFQQGFTKLSHRETSIVVESPPLPVIGFDSWSFNYLFIYELFVAQC